MINVRFNSMLLSANGYAEVGRRVGFSLAEMNNIRINFLPIGGGSIFDSEIQTFITKYNSSTLKSTDPAINITLMIPSYLKKAKGPNILYTMIECGSVNHKFVHECNQADEIWVPGEWNRKILRDGGVKKPICVFPFGVDFNAYSTKERLFDSKTFNFLCIANWDFRKGLETLIPAFLEEFQNNKNVKLILKVSHRARHGQPADDYAKRTISQLTKLPTEQIEIISRPLSLYELPRLYRSCHCFVLPSYGEGFNLCALESIATQTPLITTRFGAHLDFLNDSNSYLIDCEKRTVPNLNSVSSYYSGQIWGVPNKDHLKQLMRNVYENYSQATEKTKIAYEQCQKYDLKKTIIPIYKRLEEIYTNGYFLVPQQTTEEHKVVQPVKIIETPIPQRPKILYNSMNSELQKKVTVPLKYNFSSV